MAAPRTHSESYTRAKHVVVNTYYSAYCVLFLVGVITLHSLTGIFWHNSLCILARLWRSASVGGHVLHLKAIQVNNTVQ